MPRAEKTAKPKTTTSKAPDRIKSPSTSRDLGQRLWQLRHENRWTLDDIRKRTGVAVSTLSKLEHGEVDVTFETLMKICDGLDLSLDHLVQHRQDVFMKGVRTITRKNHGLVMNSANYKYEVLSTEVSRKGVVPTVVRVKAREIKEFKEMSRHPGEEFIYVIRGRILLHTEFYEPTVLEEGDSAHYDSSMGHAFLSVSEEDAIVLSVSHDSTGAVRGVAGHLSELLEKPA